MPVLRAADVGKVLLKGGDFNAKFEVKVIDLGQAFARDFPKTVDRVGDLAHRVAVWFEDRFGTDTVSIRSSIFSLLWTCLAFVFL